MAARAYSECFLQGRAPTAAGTYVVPDGKRIVLRQITLCIFAVPMAAYVVINGYPVFWRQPIPAQSTVNIEGRWVAYDSQSLSVGSDSGDISWHLSGYVFGDP